MRGSGFWAFVLMFSGALIACPLYAQGARTEGHGVSAGPTAIAGSNSVLALGGRQAVGTLVDLENLPHWNGTESRAGLSSTFVARNQDEWRAIWERNIGQRAPIALPNDKMALAVFLGPKSTEGYSVSFATVRVDGDNTSAMYVENKPADPDALREHQTSPWVVQLVPLLQGRVRFSKFYLPE